MEYLDDIPKKIPKGYFLCHNHEEIGAVGFRFWLARASDHYDKCDCEWGKRLPHYRVRRR